MPVLKPETELIFLGSRQWTNPNNQKTLTFAKFGCKVTFENYEFFADPTKMNLNHTMHAPCNPIFEMGIYNGKPSLQLKDVLPVK